MKKIAKHYLENVHRAITESTSAKNPCYGYFTQMVKLSVLADGGKISPTLGGNVIDEGVFFVAEMDSFMIDSDEIYKWFSRK